MSNLSMLDYYLYVRLQTGTKYTYTYTKMHKICIFCDLAVCLFDFDLDKGFNLIFSVDLKQVYAVAYLDKK